MPQWTIYTRPGCSLCDQMCEELGAALAPAEAAQVRVVNIDGDAELERRYATRIPVLTVDGEFVCAYKLDRERLEVWLRAPG